MSDAVLKLSEANFDQEVTKSDLPVMVDFWAQWCGPCKMIAPVVDELAGAYQGKLKVAKVNVDDSPSIASKFGIMSIPTLLFFKEGQIYEKVVGAVSKGDIEKKIQTLL